MISKFFRQVPFVWRTLAQRYAVSEQHGVVVASIAVTGLVLLVRQLGGLQPLELAAFDQMVRLRPDPGYDPRLLVVAIAESDIRALKKWPLSDQILAQVLAELQQHQPKAIGLDLFRDIPNEPGYPQLVAQFQNPKIIGITSMGNTEDESIPPPPSLPKERVGFNNVVTDPDGSIRRNLLFLSTEKGVLHSFSLRLALTYLAARGILPKLTDSGDYLLGKTVFRKLRANSGGYQTIDARKYKIQLNYRSRNVAQQVTLMQVLNKTIDPRLVKDKIVLIGATAPSLKDSFFTPYSAAERKNPKMPGVLIHAQMVSQILGATLDNQPLLWYWSELVEVLWVAGWALLGGIVAGRIHNPQLLGLSAIACVGVLFGCCFGLFMQGGWIPFAAPALGAIATGVSVVTYQSQQARQQQQMVMKLLGQQTSPEIATALWKERDRLLQSGILPGQTVTVTVLFTDIKDFTTISEQNTSEVLMSWLNEYLRAMTEEVTTHQGIINKFIGDAVMAVFGVPIPRTTKSEIASDARRAVNCALAMGDRLRELNRDWSDRGLPVIQIRAGIFTGPVTVGSLGGKERLEYGVIGDSVNVAARLESCAKNRHEDDCRILIAGETHSYIQGEFEVEFWGPMQLKGKEQTVDVYRVVGRG